MKYTFGPEMPKMMKIVHEGTARTQPIMCYQGCGRPEHGSAACNSIAPIIVTVDEHPCEAYRQGIRTVIKGLLDGDDLGTVMNALTDLLAYD